MSAPDNVPIVGLIPLLAFYIYLAWKQAHANDLLIAQLEADAALAKTHHRKAWPFKPGWQKEVHVWPFLLRIEFLAAIIVTIILMVWSITLNAPLEEPANPNLTMNPAKAPWYFLGLQEMLVYFDPWIAGVVMPTLIIVGLMVIPYIDTNPLGSGYYTWKQRKFAIATFLFGFIILWVSMIIIGTFIRGPGWQWFWPGQTWDHNRLIYEVNRDLPDIFGITSNLGKIIFGAVVVGGSLRSAASCVYALFRRYKPKNFSAHEPAAVLDHEVFLLIMLACRSRCCCACCGTSSTCGLRHGLTSSGCVVCSSVSLRFSSDESRPMLCTRITKRPLSQRLHSRRNLVPDKPIPDTTRS